ncbi:MAG TPA: CoA transferase [Spirillospora sp.]|nr:CoA transferase [Spirillospora sp.]
MKTTARPVAAPASRPLDGTLVRASGGSVAVRVAAARLRALGCAIETADGPPPPDAPAGLLRVVRAPWIAAGGAPPECRIGWSGPVRVPMAGERDVQAACGIMHVHGRATGGPRALHIDYASVCAGVLAAQAVTAGMLAVLRGGTAVRAATSVAQAAALALTQYVAVATTTDPGSGSSRPEPGRERTPPFRSADGVRFEIETFRAEAWLRFWTEAGAERSAIAAGWTPFQQRFATGTCMLPSGLQAAAAALDYAAVRRAAEAAGVSIVTVNGAGTPLPPAPASPWRLRPLPAAPAIEAVPVPGDLTRSEDGPLAGIRVVEATNRVQGPLSGHVLGLLGADVVRLEPPGGDPMRGVPPMAGPFSARFLALNRGKDVVEADLKSRAGRATALRLAASAEVFLQNWAPGRAARFGLDAADLAAVRPRLVYAYAGGWAGALPAPQPMGTDYLVQAHTGVAALLSGPGRPPAPTLMTIIDVLGALISAEGVVAGLLGVARTGAGVRVETALADAGRLLRESHAPLSRTAGEGAPVVSDLAAMAADPAYAALFETDGAACYSRAPWTFTRATDHHREGS